MYRCLSCDRTIEPGAAVWRCSCGGPLTFESVDLRVDAKPALSGWESLWDFASLLPIEQRVTLGEGWTPLVDSDAPNTAYKLEWLFPTGSFKDRGAATTLSHASALGVERVIEDSSGNAGAAIATYAARAGIEATIYVPADAKPSKIRAIERTGATVEPVEGDRQAVTDACIAAVEDPATTGWYASHAWNPAFFEGTATFAYEIAAQRDWAVPDAIVVPLGHGTLFLGAYLGFRRLEEVGWTDSVPRLYGVQAAGAAPIVADRHGESVAQGSNEVADGIQITDPVRRAQIHDAIDETGGDAVAVSDTATEQALEALHESGFYVEPTSAVARAGLEQLRDAGAIGANESVVVALTGSGLKHS